MVTTITHIGVIVVTMFEDDDPVFSAMRIGARRLSNQEIADELEISITTVATHVRNILGKLHQANRTQAALYAIEQGISPSE